MKENKQNPIGFILALQEPPEGIMSEANNPPLISRTHPPALPLVRDRLSLLKQRGGGNPIRIEVIILTILRPFRTKDHIVAPYSRLHPNLYTYLFIKFLT
jgi:hypothetical protein